MPHLSPLNWLLSPFIFYMLLALFSMILWWSQTLLFPMMQSYFTTPSLPAWTW